jgi:hypothetical protein
LDRQLVVVTFIANDEHVMLWEWLVGVASVLAFIKLKPMLSAGLLAAMQGSIYRIFAWAYITTGGWDWVSSGQLAS